VAATTVVSSKQQGKGETRKEILLLKLVDFQSLLARELGKMDSLVAKNWLCWECCTALGLVVYQ